MGEFLTKRRFRNRVKEAKELVAKLSSSYNMNCIAEELNELETKENIGSEDLKRVEKLLSLLKGLCEMNKEDFKRYESLLVVYLERGYSLPEIPELISPDEDAQEHLWGIVSLITPVIACDYKYRLQQDAEQVEVMLSNNEKWLESLKSFGKFSNALHATWIEFLSHEEKVIKELKEKLERLKSENEVKENRNIERLVQLKDELNELNRIRREVELQEDRIEGYYDYARKYLVKAFVTENNPKGVFKNVEEVEKALSEDIVLGLKQVTNTHSKRNDINFDQYACRIKRELAEIIFNQIEGKEYGA